MHIAIRKFFSLRLFLLVSLVSLFAGALADGPSARAAEPPPYVLRIATTLPASSIVGKWLNEWKKALEARSIIPAGQPDAGQKRLRVDLMWNGTQGDESNIVGKIRTGQLDGGLLSTSGLGRINRSIPALEIPGLFPTYADIDAALSALQPELDESLEAQGFQALAWSVYGQARIFSQGYPVARPRDLNGRNAAVGQGDFLTSVLLAKLKDTGVIQEPSSIMEVLLHLQSRRVSVVAATAFVAEQFQWASRLTHVRERPVAPLVGAFVMRQSALDALPPDLREAALSLAQQAEAALNRDIRTHDASAYSRLAQQLTVQTSTATDDQEWRDAFQRAHDQLKHTFTIPPLWLSRVPQFRTLGQ